MAAALQAIDADPASRVVRVSGLYRTPPWGRTDQPDFINATAEIATTRGARELLELCLDTERSLKRVRNERWGPRTVDLDVLVYGDMDVEEPGLHVPHPRMLERAFVMVPLAEIAPLLLLSGRPAREWLEGLDLAGIERLGAPRDWWKAVAG